MKRIRLLLISNMFPSDEDKFYGIFVKNFVLGFENTNIEIISKSLIYGRGQNNFQKIVKYVNFYCSILKNVLKFNYDLIYVHNPNYVSIPLLICLPLVRNPIVLNFHGTDVFAKSKLAKLFLFLVKPIVRISHTIVVPSEYFKEIVVAKFNIPSTKIFVSPSAGINTNEFISKDEKKKLTTFTIGYVGRIDEGKGWNILLEAIAKVKSNIPNLKCIIAGNGKQVTNLNKQVIALGVSEIVSFIGPLSHNELPEFYNRLDVFVFPTQLNESLGLVGIEALSCGIPVIGSKIGGLKDYIIEDLNGLFFEPGNSAELAKKIEYLHTNPDRLKKYIKNARISVSKFDYKKVNSSLINKLEEITGNY